MLENKIGYTTDISKPYADSLKRAKDIEALRLHVKEWELLAPDAFDAVHSPEFSWKEYADGVKKERRNVFAGEEWAEKYGAIMMPEVLIRIALVAQHYCVPDGLAFIRLRDTGQLTVANGRATLIKSNGQELGRAAPVVTSSGDGS